MPEALSLEDVLQRFFSGAMLGVFTVLPGRIESFSPSAKPSATVQILVADYQAGDPVPFPPLANVPVCFPAPIRWTVAPGSSCIVLFASRSLERYRATGDEGDPQSFRFGDLSDAWCIPLLGGNDGAAVGTGLAAARATDPVDRNSNLATWMANVEAALAAHSPIATPWTFGGEIANITSGSPNVEID